MLIGLYFGYMTIRDDIRNEMELRAKRNKEKLSQTPLSRKTNRTQGGSTSVTFFRKDKLCQLKRSV
ncbi:hypothetical protein ABG808_10520 [Streptococcus iniae]